jgi:hypothetical protein
MGGRPASALGLGGEADAKRNIYIVPGLILGKGAGGFLCASSVIQGAPDRSSRFAVVLGLSGPVRLFRSLLHSRFRIKGTSPVFHPCSLHQRAQTVGGG